MSTSYHEQVTALVQAMRVEPQSYESLMLFSGLSQTTVIKWVAAWREAHLVHVAGWGADSRGYPTIQLMAWSPGAEDVPAPAMTGAERVKNWKARQKKVSK